MDWFIDQGDSNISSISFKPSLKPQGKDDDEGVQSNLKPQWKSYQSVNDYLLQKGKGLIVLLSLSKSDRSLLAALKIRPNK